MPSVKQYEDLKWTIEALFEESLKYSTRNEFRKTSKGAYYVARTNGIINEICYHMVERVKFFGPEHHNFKWTNEMLQEEALKYDTRWGFIEGSSSAYAISLRRGVLDIICRHMERGHKPRRTDSELREEALKYSSRADFKKNSSASYSAAIERGILDEICEGLSRRTYLSGENSATFKWTNEKLAKEALKYKTKREFRENSGSASLTASRRGTLDEICAHMPPPAKG